MLLSMVETCQRYHAHTYQTCLWIAKVPLTLCALQRLTGAGIWGKQVQHVGTKTFVPLCMAAVHEPNNFLLLISLQYHEPTVTIHTNCKGVQTTMFLCCSESVV